MRVPLELTAAQVTALSRAVVGPSPVVYITSSDSVATLMHAMRVVPGAREWFAHGAAVTIHPRCADRLREAGFTRIEIVGTDDERVRNAVMQCLSCDF